jgi:malto-oligosyltrehalose trehalohydrolase
VHLVLENYANQACRLAPLQGSAALLSRAQWNDDFHHAVHVLLTAEDDGHYADYVRAPLQQLGRVLAEGFAFQGEPFTTRRNEPRGEKSAHLPPTAFIDFLQNHDQIGNRALGERLGHLIDSDRLRAGLALLLLSPAVPLLFMGEEYAAPQPFQFFCDYRGELGTAITAGRRSEFAGFRGFAEVSIPDPNDPATFARSKLKWCDRLRPPHDGWLAYVRMLLAIRAQHIVPLIPGIVAGAATYQVIGSNILAVTWTTDSNHRLTIMANLAEASSPALTGGTVTETGERIFASIATAGATLQPWEVRVQLHSS